LASSERDYYLLSVAYYGGMRGGEVVAMQPRYIRTDHGDILVPSLKRKRESHRGVFCDATDRPLLAVPILFGDAVLKAAKDWASDRRFIFQSPQGPEPKPISQRQFAYTFKRWAKVAGLDPQVSPHSLRHSAISHVQDAVGNDLVLLRDFARHANISTTNTYLHATPAKLRRARKAMRKIDG